MRRVRVKTLAPEAVALRRVPFGPSGGVFLPDDMIPAQAKQIHANLTAMYRIEAIGSKVPELRADLVVGEYVAIGAGSGHCWLEWGDDAVCIVDKCETIGGTIEYYEVDAKAEAEKRIAARRGTPKLVGLDGGELKSDAPPPADGGPPQ